MARKTGDDDTQKGSGMTRTGLSRAHLRELLNVLMRSPTSTIQQVGYLLMLLAAIALMNWSTGNAEKEGSVAGGARDSRTTDGGTGGGAVGRHVSCDASEEREKAAVCIAAATKEMRARKKSGGGKNRGGRSADTSRDESGEAKVKSLRCWSAKVNQNVGKLLQLFTGPVAPAISPKHIHLLHFFAKGIPREKAGKALPAAAVALDFMMSVIEGAIRNGHRSANTSVPTCKTGTSKDSVYEASTTAGTLQGAVVDSMSLEKSVATEDDPAPDALSKTCLPAGPPTTAPPSSSLTGYRKHPTAAATGAKMSAGKTKQRRSEEAIDADSATVSHKPDPKPDGGSSSRGSGWSLSWSEKNGEGGSNDTAASTPADSRYVADSRPPERVVTRQPAFILSAGGGTPPLTIRHGEAVTTARRRLAWTRQQDDLRLEDALVLPPGTSLALDASGPCEELTLSDVLVLPSVPPSEMLEGQRADADVDDSYGGGQILLHGRVVTEAPPPDASNPAPALSAPIGDVASALSPYREESPEPGQEKTPPSIEPHPSSVGRRGCGTSDSFARSPSGSPSRGRQRSRPRSRSPAGRPLSRTESLGSSGPDYAGQGPPSRFASPRSVSPSILASPVHRSEPSTGSVSPSRSRGLRGTRLPIPSSPDQAEVASDASSFGDSGREGAAVALPVEAVTAAAAAVAGTPPTMATGAAKGMFGEDDVERQNGCFGSWDGSSSRLISGGIDEDADAPPPMIGRMVDEDHGNFFTRGETSAAVVLSGGGGSGDGSLEGINGGTASSYVDSRSPATTAVKNDWCRGESPTGKEMRTMAAASESAAVFALDGDIHRASFVPDRQSTPTADVVESPGLEPGLAKLGSSSSSSSGGGGGGGGNNVAAATTPFDENVCRNALKASLDLEAKTYPLCRNGYGCLAQAKKTWGLSIIGQIAGEIGASTQTIALAAFTLGTVVGDPGLTTRVNNEELSLLPAACVLDSLVRSDRVNEDVLEEALDTMSWIMLAVLEDGKSDGGIEDDDDDDEEQKKRASFVKGRLINLRGRVARGLPSGLYCATPMDYVEVFMEQCGIYDTRTREESDVIFEEAEEIVQCALLDGFLGWMPPSKIACVAFFGVGGVSIAFKSKLAQLTVERSVSAVDTQSLGNDNTGEDVKDTVHRKDGDRGTGGADASEAGWTPTWTLAVARPVAVASAFMAASPVMGTDSSTASADTHADFMKREVIGGQAPSLAGSLRVVGSMRTSHVPPRVFEQAPAVHYASALNNKGDSIDCLVGVGELPDCSVGGDTCIGRGGIVKSSSRPHRAVEDQGAPAACHDRHREATKLFREGGGTVANGCMRRERGIQQRLNTSMLGGVRDLPNDVMAYIDPTSKEILVRPDNSARWVTCHGVNAGGIFECGIPGEAGHAGGNKRGDYDTGDIALRPRSDADIAGVVPPQAITGRQQREWWLHWHKSCGL